jgi:L-amino acid N-acyltransferase YncA
MSANAEKGYVRSFYLECLFFKHRFSINWEIAVLGDAEKMLSIRLATQKDSETIWSIIQPVIRAGDTYALDSNMTKDKALSYWMATDKWTFVAEENDEIFGTYYMKTNQAGGGSHVCNCGYITSENTRRRGIARQMCEHSLTKASELGFKAMQYNCVLSTNEGAVSLWKRLGFDIVGTIPKVFKHPTEGYVDAFVMYQFLEQ